MKKPVSLLMPVLNEEQSAAITLDSVFRSTRLPDEIIIADGGSTDNTIPIVESYRDKGVKITIVENPGVFAGAGRNEAFAECTGDILVLLDFGNIISEDWIELTAKPFEEIDDLDFIGSIYQPIVKSDFQHCVAAVIYFLNSRVSKMNIEEIIPMIPETPEPPGALGLAVSREMWQRCGGMPGWLRAAEDKLFGRKMMLLNPTYHFVPEVRMGHHMRETPGDIFKQMLVYYRGHARTHYKIKEFLKILLIYLVAAALLFALPWSIQTFTLLLLLALAYLWRTGLIKVVQIDRGLKKWSYIPMTFVIVIARDLGCIAGYLLGLKDWIFDPVYRNNYTKYMEIGDSKPPALDEIDSKMS